MSVFKVRDAFLALTYEQQAMIVDDWMERKPAEAVAAPVATSTGFAAAPKVSAIPAVRSRKVRTRRLVDPAHVEKIKEMIGTGFTASEISRFMARHYPGIRSELAWEAQARIANRSTKKASEV